MSKHDLRKIRTRLSLEKSLIELLKRKSLKEIQIKELTSKAMISRKTFYGHYDIIEELYEDCVKSILADIEQETSFLYEKTQHYSNRELLFHAFKIYGSRADELKVLLQVEDKDLFMHSIYNCLKTIIDILLPTVDSDNNKFKTHKHFLKCNIAGGFYAVLREWIIYRPELTPMEITDIYIETTFSFGNFELLFDNYFNSITNISND